MKSLFVVIALAGLALGGCQVAPPSKFVLVPLPAEPLPPTTIAVIGTGDTPEAAREAAINQLAHRVILPRSEPEKTPPAEFVAALIRGYNIKSTERDLVGRYYVTLELPVTQLGANFQELFLYKQESDLYKKQLENEKKLRELAEQRNQDTTKSTEEQNKIFTTRILALEAEIDTLKHKTPVQK
jgi:hypothetical protein